ncbi:MAG: ATPase domain-containing protein [Candidatus Woesearchaeota archaeon]
MNQNSNNIQINELKQGNEKLIPEKSNEKNKEIYFLTGIQGFDDLVGKGFPKGSQILVSGGPGTMKTTFCLQILTNLSKKGHKCLYLTFEEPEENLIRNVSSYGWNIQDLIKNKKLMIKSLDPFKMSRNVETLLAQARGELLIEINEAKNLLPNDFDPEFVVIDSLSAISAGFFGKKEGYRAYMSQIFDTFRKMKINTFLITEIEHSTTRYSQSGVEEFLADGVIALYNFRQGNQRINAIEIIKLRGVEHKKRIVPFKAIANQGIIVYPLEELFIQDSQ